MDKQKRVLDAGDLVDVPLTVGQIRYFLNSHHDAQEAMEE